MTRARAIKQSRKNGQLFNQRGCTTIRAELQQSLIKRYSRGRRTRKSAKRQKGGHTIHILIYCHEDILTYRGDNNDGEKIWSQDQKGPYKCSAVVERIIDMNGWNDHRIHFDTIDLLHGGTFQEDGFHDSFIDKHTYKYDLVYLPDCGGDWYTLQTEAHKDYNKLLAIILSISRLVKEKGILVLSKFSEKVFERFRIYDRFSDALVHKLEDNGFNVDTDKFKNIPGCGSYFRFLSIYAVRE